MISLYVKTHNTTGLKYFGKTNAKDPHKYTGSGKYWRRHIKVHGYNVTTEIVAQFEDATECTKFAIDFSQKNNIVESNDWANFKIENGMDGGFTHLNDGSESHLNRCSVAGKKCHEIHDKIVKENLSKGRTSESALKGSLTKKQLYGDDYYIKIASGKKSEEHKRNISVNMLGKKQNKVECPHCGKIGGERAMKRHHFDKCKLIPDGI